MKVKIFEGNCLDALKTLPDESVHTVVTSPPYLGLRSYETTPQIWGGDPNCDHEWSLVKTKRPNASGGQNSRKLKTKRAENFQASVKYKDRTSSSNYCKKCSAWYGELGVEPTPHQYVKNLITIFREIKRVLHNSGLVFINIADSYNGSGGSGGDYNKGGIKEGQPKYPGRKIPGLKQGDLCGIPWMVALALRDDGWYLRASNIWAKGVSFCPSYSGSVMPESVDSRTTRAHEYVFMLSKSKKYFYDIDAVREPNSALSCGINKIIPNDDRYIHGGRNLRSVWAIPTEQFSGQHFAVMPKGLVEPCIKAGTSEKGCCAECKAPYERIIERIGSIDNKKVNTEDEFNWVEENLQV
jgi:site-specific DNA-methyltransferase (adenine-specific)